MSQSPAKRRKTSGNSSVSATTANTNAPVRSTPTTPTRASYLSPTKASLARSHPHLVSPNKRQSLTEPRGRSLRNELLGRKDTNVTGTEKLVAEDPDSTEQQAEYTLPAAAPASAKRGPLQQRQAAVSPRPHPLPRSLSPDFLPPPIIPTLVKKPPIRAPSHPLSNEPELPPTPVQLGLDDPPERPRGLSSSSPRGSKSGSGRRRLRRLDGHSVTSSPLKPRAPRRTTMQEPAPPDLKSQPDEAQEAPESEALVSDSAAIAVQEEIKEKKQILRNLRLELSKLKAQTKEIESAIETNDLPDSSVNNAWFLDLLKIASRSSSSRDAEFEQNPNTIRHEANYFHTLFAPGNLQLSTKTSTKLIKNQAKLIHHVIITAPPPWPSHLFLANFEVITDAENVAVERLTWVDALIGHTQAPGIQDELHDWIKERLNSEMHRLDAGGLIWGVGLYFAASIERAKVFRSLAMKYEATNDIYDSDDENEHEADHQPTKDGSITGDEAITLTRYLSKSQLTFSATNSSSEDSTVTTRRTRKSTPKIMAVWNLLPQWHGEVRSSCEVVPSGIPQKAQEAVVELFQSVKRVAGFEKAFEAVWEMIADAEKGAEGNEVVEGKEKGLGKKRKRFT